MSQKQVYLVAKYSAKPRNRSQTYKAGYMTDPENVAYDEAVDVTVGLRNKDLSTARIILNITKQKVEKNSFTSGKSFMELFQYFYTNSPQEISHALQRVGISITEPAAEETTNESIDVRENVQTEGQASTGSEPSSTTNTVGASKAVKRRPRGNLADAEPSVPAAGTDKSAKKRAKASAVQD